MTTRKSQGIATEIEAEASSWFVEIHSGEASRRDKKNFERWLAADEQHRTAYQRIERLMERMSALDAVDVDHLLPKQESNEGQSGDYRRLPSFRPLSWIAPIGLVTAVLLMLAGIVAYQADFWRQNTFITEHGERRSVELADGSVVHLNTATTIDVDLTDSLRAVSLMQGEAFFKVAHDPSRPFIVVLPDRVVRAVGTAFNIYVEGGLTAVTVTEGVVQIFASSAPDKIQAQGDIAELTMGQQFIYDVATHSERVQAADIDVVSAWLSGKIIFKDMPLEEVINQFTRYTQHEFIFDDDKLRKISVNGTFDPSDVESLNAALQLALPIEARMLNSQTTVLSARTEK